ncbi:MAG TPA: fasciclin domain-containing protein [Dyella sp.]|uniref:fasciclin domain-containing protein n=1 Tax=Dyella sp. TaxID=1869338 RepID=UPI002D77033D|nr:fasciclin domain-containing protein [Dyella sp.]HET6553032.1 fasciclin domain-containing protein [Dyella sp.]
MSNNDSHVARAGSKNLVDTAAVVKYHVMAGRASGSDVEKLTAPKMMQGQTATVTKDGNKLQSDGATAMETDIASSNGLIRAIDRVNVPAKQ